MKLRRTRQSLEKILPAALLTGVLVFGTGCRPLAHIYPPSPVSGPCAERVPLPLGAPVIGVHGLANPAVAVELGAESVRLILSDDAIRAGFAVYDAGGSPDFAIALARFHEVGIPVIIAIRWPEIPGIRGTPDFDRVPTGPDRTESLALLRRFLWETAGQVAWYQLQNEPLGGPGAYRIEDRPASIEWLTVLAEEACTARTDDPVLADLRLMSPGLTGLDADNPDPETTAYLGELLRLADTHLEAVDVHLHVDSVDTAAVMLDVARAETDLPLVSMEWSQAKVARSWLGQLTTDFRFGSGTNRDFVNAAYVDPVSADLWSDFIATSPHDPDFMLEIRTMLSGRLVQIACYGGANQFGTPLFDLKALFANLTVGGRTPSEPFYSNFRALTGG